MALVNKIPYGPASGGVAQPVTIAASGNGRILIAAGLDDRNPSTFTTLYFNGVAGTLIEKRASVEGSQVAGLWYWLDADMPAAAGTYDITMDGDGSNRYIGALYAEGAPQNAPDEVEWARSDTSSANTPIITDGSAYEFTLATLSGNALLFFGASAGAGNPAGNAGQTDIGAVENRFASLKEADSQTIGGTWTNYSTAGAVVVAAGWEAPAGFSVSGVNVSSAAVGGTVSLSGNALDTATSVSIGGESVAFTYNGTTSEIDVVIPDGVLPYGQALDVAVSDGTTTSTLADALTISPAEGVAFVTVAGYPPTGVEGQSPEDLGQGYDPLPVDGDQFEYSNGPASLTVYDNLDWSSNEGGTVDNRLYRAGSGWTAMRTTTVTQKPTITLTGDNPFTLEKGTPYVEPGYSASDPEDGDLTASVIVTGTIDENTLGAQTLTYSVTDSAGATTTVTRTVNVVDTTAPTLSSPSATVTGTTTVDGSVQTNEGSGTLAWEFRRSADDVVLDSGSQAVTATGVQTVSANGLPIPTSGYFWFQHTDGEGNVSAAVTSATVSTNNPPVITLEGGGTSSGAPLTLEYGSAYVEPGYSATDAEDGDLTANVEVAGAINPTLLGIQALVYSVDDLGGATGTATRYVEVVNTTKPVIGLLGASRVELQVGDVWSDPGAIATATVDGVITDQIVTGGSVDTSVAGPYYRTYDVTDDQGNAADTVTRTIVVRTVSAAPVTHVYHVSLGAAA
jgi:hypothetical protein